MDGIDIFFHNSGAINAQRRQQSKLEVRGVLWILDELEAHALLSSIQLADALESMLKAGARLPESECHQRLGRWR